MKRLPPGPSGQNGDGVKRIDSIASEQGIRHNERFSPEAEDAISPRIDLDRLRRPFWDRHGVFLALLFFCVLGSGLVLKRIYFPEPGRIYHVPHFFTSGWTERDLEREFGSPGKLVSGSRGSPNGYALEWKGKGSHCLIHFDGDGRQGSSTMRIGGTTIFDDITAFFGLPDP